MKRLILGILYCALWYISILVGFFLFICPLLPLVFLHPKLYRDMSERVFGMWEPFPVALMEIFFGIRVVLTGDQIDPFERSLLIMNHRTRLDWNFLWVALFHCCHPYSHALKYVLKAAVMHFPGPGWVMQTCSFLFVHRNWKRDQALLGRLVEYLDVSDQPYQILIFPEGTDLTPDNIAKSHKYADGHNLQRYYNVLHPRTTGFAFLAYRMKLGGKIKAVYDITVAYPGRAPQNEVDLVKGNFPDEVHFHVKRYNASEIPSTETELKAWLCDIWKMKERFLSKFQNFGSFSRLENEERNQTAGHSNDYEKNTKVTEMNTPKQNGNFSKTSNEPEESESREDADQNPFHRPEIDVNLTSSAESVSGTETEVDGYNLVCSSNSFTNRYRPSHLLYLTFLFWIFLIWFTVQEFFVNSYVQIWVLVHTLFFTAISFFSNGFQHIIASIYFYRYKRKTTKKKSC